MGEDASGGAPFRVVLIGMMGSGKSAVGSALSARTGGPFLDNDELLERATGRTARELLERDGEPALRAAESLALRTAVRVPRPAVVATAAGTIMNATDRGLIERAGYVVWLRVGAEVLAARAAGGAHRPWLRSDPVGWFREALSEREGHYAEIADLHVDTGSVTPPEAADRILGALGHQAAGVRDRQ